MSYKRNYQHSRLYSNSIWQTSTNMHFIISILIKFSEFQRTPLVLLCNALWIVAVAVLFSNSLVSTVPDSAWRWSFNSQ